jgi:hypothetical protein
VVVVVVVVLSSLTRCAAYGCMSACREHQQQRPCSSPTLVVQHTHSLMSALTRAAIRHVQVPHCSCLPAARA